MAMKEIFPGIWRREGRLFTRNLVPGNRDFCKKPIVIEGEEYREWNPCRSKPAAAIMQGIKKFPVRAGSKVLYLGAANGQTCTFISDIVGEEGVIYAVEFSERCMRDLTAVAEKRGNIVPILGDARKPEDYEWIEQVDVILEDVASEDQGPVMVRNAEKFLKPDGHAVIAIKARSIDVVKEPEEIYKREISRLGRKFKILDKVKLDPYEKDHMLLVMKKKLHRKI